MSHPGRFLLFVSCSLLLASACTPQPLTVTREPVAIRLVTADSCRPLAEELIAAYEKSHPWTTVELIGVFNSATVEQTLWAGEADLALLSWLEENAEGEALWAQPFARDGIAIIAHPTTPFAETGLAHLQEIFRGRIQEWEGTILTVVSREAGSGARSAFDSAVLDNYDVTQTAVVMSSNEAALEHVARTPGSIGYVSTLLMSESDAVRVLPVEGISPGADAISDGSYPLSRPLYLAAVSEPTGTCREFAQWIVGPEGQAVAEQR
jgi:phosphate transport system substrate-binding protein